MNVEQLGQFLVDNADLIEQWLEDTDNYRTVRVECRAYKANPHFDNEIVLYDGVTGNFSLATGTLPISIPEALQRKYKEKENDHN